MYRKNYIKLIDNAVSKLSDFPVEIEEIEKKNFSIENANAYPSKY